MTIQKAVECIRKFWKELLLVLSLLLVGFLSWRVHTLEGEIDKTTATITVMSQEHAENLNALQNELDVNKQNAEVLQRKIIDAQHGLRRPDAIYKTRLDTNGTIYTTLERKLDTGDSTLPPEALEKTDRTVVVEQKDNPEIPVGIYKINTYKNWEVGTGIGVQNDNPYIPLSIQRNYARNRSILLEAHYGLKDQQINGGEVQWKVHF